MNKLEALDSSHDRAGFDCGSEPLNQYLQQVARQHGEKGVSNIFVLVEANATPPKPVLGFFSLAACEVDSDSFPAALAKKLPRKIPAVRLGRLAVNKIKQGSGLGKDLVMMAVVKTALGASNVGIAGLFVDAKDDSVARFYAKFGFVPLPSSPLTLFIPRATVLQLAAAFQGPQQ